MKLSNIILILCLTFAGAFCDTAIPEGTNSVPASLKYLSDTMGYTISITDWVKLCNTNKSGTTVDCILPAWRTAIKESSLVPIYVIPETGVPFLDTTFAPFRKAEIEDAPVQLGAFKYLWIGLHPDVTGKTTSIVPHCGVVIFKKEYAHLISPNIILPNGKMLEEDIDYTTFLRRTLIIFDAYMDGDNPGAITQAKITTL